MFLGGDIDELERDAEPVAGLPHAPFQHRLDVELATETGALLQGEVMARWQDFAGTGDLLRTLQVRRGRGGKQRKQQTPATASALKSLCAPHASAAR